MTDSDVKSRSPDCKINDINNGLFIAVDKKYIAFVETELDTECEILWCKIVM